MKTILFPLPCGFSILAISLATEASIVLGFSFPELVASSDVIVQGVVVASKCSDQKGLVITKNLVRAERCFKGCELSDGAAIEIVTLGGSKNGVGFWIPGEASFTVQERFVAFLRLQEGSFRVVGMAQ